MRKIISIIILSLGMINALNSMEKKVSKNLMLQVAERSAKETVQALIDSGNSYEILSQQHPGIFNLYQDSIDYLTAGSDEEKDCKETSLEQEYTAALEKFKTGGYRGESSLSEVQDLLEANKEKISKRVVIAFVSILPGVFLKIIEDITHADEDNVLVTSHGFSNGLNGAALSSDSEEKETTSGSEDNRPSKKRKEVSKNLKQENVDPLDERIKFIVESYALKPSKFNYCGSLKNICPLSDCDVKMTLDGLPSHIGSRHPCLAFDIRSIPAFSKKGGIKKFLLALNDFCTAEPASKKKKNGKK